METNETASKIKGIVIGYVRVSSEGQNCDRQEESINALQPDRMFIDRVSGKDTNRPQLQEMLRFAREGDVIVIHSLDRLARSLSDLCSLVKDLTGRGITVKFLKESLVFGNGGNGDSATGQLMMHLLGAIAEFERSLIKSRQREGIDVAMKAGKYRGRKPALTTEQAHVALQRIAAGVPVSKVARDMKVSRQTVYSHLKTVQAAPTPAKGAH